MRPRPLAVAFLLALLHTSAGAQSFFGEVMEVRITNVDVIVTGKDGKPVSGLKREDFELYEDGVKQEITNFLEVSEDATARLTPSAVPQQAAPVPADFRGRNITIFIDNAGLKPQSRNAVLPHLEKFVDANVRPGDEVAIVSWSSSLKLELDATSDRNAIREAMQRLATQTTRGSELAQEREQFQRSIVDIIIAKAMENRKPTFDEVLSIARAHAMWATHQARQRAEALKSVIASMRGEPGRKIVLFVTQAFSSNPAEWVFLFLETFRDSFDGYQNTALTDARSYELPGLVMEIAEAANSSAVTLYAIDASGKETDSRLPDVSERVRVGLRTIVVAPTEGLTLQSIAADTGGVALTGSTNWQLAFDTIASDLDTYYSLGYKASGEQDRLKNLEVRVKNRKYKVRTRSAVIEPSISSEMNDAVAASLFRDIGRNDLAIRASAAPTTASAEAEKSLIPLTVTIPTEKLTLLPDGTDLTGSFSLFAAFLRNDGRVSKVARQPHSFRFPAESLPRRKEITVKLDVTTDSNTDAISVGVMDEASRAVGFAAVRLTAHRPE